MKTIHLTALQSGQITSALVSVAVAVISSLGVMVASLVVLGTKKLSELSAKVESNTLRIGHTEQSVYTLNNGGGDKKIEAVINSKIVDGTLKGGVKVELTGDTDRNTVGDVLNTGT